jgi:CCR4-NOT complex subunit CAF16
MQVLLLDEITVDLDVLARSNLLTYLKKECEERGATIIYATHIFDGLDDWPTHIVSSLVSHCLYAQVFLVELWT